MNRQLKITLWCVLAIAGVIVFGLGVRRVARYIEVDMPLEAALDVHDINTCLELVKQGANPNAKRRHGRTLLHMAVQAKDKEGVNLLLDRGADPNARDDSGQTPLSRAAWAGQREIVQLLRAAGGSIDFVDAVVLNDAERVAEFLRDEPSLANRQIVSDRQGPPLYIAMTCRAGDVVRVLLDNGADPNADGIGPTLLSIAARRAGPSASETMDLFVRAGADVNHRGLKGRTALHDVVYSGSVEAAEVLLESGADVNARDDTQATPLNSLLFEAPAYNPVAELLLSRGADPNLPDQMGVTPLHRASGAGNEDAVRLLLDHGADPSAKDFQGKTPLDVANEAGHPEILHLLTAHGAAPDERAPVAMEGPEKPTQ